MKLIICLIGFVILGSQNADCGLLNRIFGHETTTTTTTPAPPPRYISNTVPHVEPGCTVVFACKQKMLVDWLPRPCIKYCVKIIKCPNKDVVYGKPNECVQLDEAQVLAEHQLQAQQKPTAEEEAILSITERIVEVAMIDFPCQPGYLPDYRGRCREVW